MSASVSAQGPQQGESAALRSPRRWEWLRIPEGRARRAAQVGLFPALMIGIPWLSIELFERFDPVAVGLAVFLGTIPLFFALERMLPWREAWIGSQGDVHTDVGLSLLAGAVAPLAEPASLAAALWIVTRLAAGDDLGLWPTHWPLLGQALLCMLISDFFRYWFHRALHVSPWLWRFHATHHSAPRLYFFNGVRLHPVEVLVNGVIQSVPILALGVGAEVLALYFVIGRVIGRFQHCNLDVRLGPLDWIFSSPKNHRWHHSADLGEAAHNYGGDVIVWDHVFGTFYLPSGREPSDRIGIGNMPTFPQRLDRVLATPFTWRRHLDLDAGVDS